MDWTGAGAIATFAAVAVALLPILAAHRARKAKARNLRMRASVKLQMLRPTFGVICQPAALKTTPAFLLRSPDELAQTVAELEVMLKDAEVLDEEEQDRLSQVVANLEMTIPAMRGNVLEPEGARSVLDLIDRAKAVFEEHGLMAGEPHQPWAGRQ